MVKKAPKKDIVSDLTGWVLIAKDEDSPVWHVAWFDIFTRKHEALRFATQNGWAGPYRAVRGRITADQ
jgi:hypothetical protein